MNSADQPKGNALTAYLAATPGLPSDLQAALYPIFVRSTLPDDDPLWSLVAVQIRMQCAINSASNGSLKPEQIEKLKSELIRAVQKENNQIICSVADMPRQVQARVDSVLQERLSELKKQDDGELSWFDHWPALARNAWDLISGRGSIALLCFLLGLLAGSLVVGQLVDNATEKRLEALTGAFERLPDMLRLEMTGHLIYAPAKQHNPATAIVNFGERFRPVSAEVTQTNEVSVTFAP
jgi:CRISPR/Cas system-associated endoribonuclease Cas2